MTAVPRRTLVALEPLLELGPDHRMVKALLNALENESIEMCESATRGGLNSEDRHWACGYASFPRDMADMITAEFERRAASK